MRFVTNPQLILTKDEFETLDKAFHLCRDMDVQTGDSEGACTMCPFREGCSHMYVDCVYARAQKALEQILDIAIEK